jgi:hypothetical protein
MNGMKKIAGAMGVLLMAGTALAQIRTSGVNIAGAWLPEVGSGSVYEVVNKGRKTSMTMAIVGKEEYQGRMGYWMEMIMQDEKGPMVMKTLMVSGGENKIEAVRTIFMMGTETFEMDLNAMPGGHQQQQTLDIRKNAQRVGTESITTPAGTFTCEHWRDTKTGGDSWISDKISPWGLVKSESKTDSTVLVQRLTGVKSKISGTPKKFDPAEMMRQRQQPPKQ